MTETRCENAFCSHPVQLFSRENSYSSKQAADRGQAPGVTQEATIVLPQGATQLRSEYVSVDAPFPLSELLSCPPFRANGSVNPCFAYRQAFAFVDGYVRYLADVNHLSLDMHLVRGILRGKPKRPLPIHVNKPNLANAFYFPANEDVTLGDGQGRFLLGTDGDIVLHETSHWVIDQINPLLAEGYFSAGMSIHEGCADGLTVLYFDDAQLAEDYGFLKFGRPTMHGLRTANNSHTLRDFLDGPNGSLDPHEIGKVYNGFFWSLAQRFDALLKERNPQAYRKDPAAFRRRALDATMKLIVAHVGEYRRPSPGYEDFTQTVIDGARGLYDPHDPKYNLLAELTDGKIDLATIEREIRAEADRREFDWAERFFRRPPPPASVAGIPFAAQPLQIANTGYHRSLFYQQLYRTKHGMVPVLGHGKIVRVDRHRQRRDHNDGVLPIAPGSLDEGVTLPREQAFNAALSVVGSHLRKKLAARTGTSAMSPADIEFTVTNALVALRRRGPAAAQLAVLTRPQHQRRGDHLLVTEHPQLVWNVQEGPVSIAIDAKAAVDPQTRRRTASTLALAVRGLID